MSHLHLNELSFICDMWWYKKFVSDLVFLQNIFWRKITRQWLQGWGCLRSAVIRWVCHKRWQIVHILLVILVWMEEIENLWEIQSFRESFLWKVPKFWLVDDSTWPLGSLFSSEGRLSTPLFSQLIVSVPLPQHILIKVWILVGFDFFIAFVMSLRWTLRPDNLKTYIRLPRSVQHFDGSVTFERIKPCTPKLKAKMKWLSIRSYGKMGREDIPFLWKKKKLLPVPLLRAHACTQKLVECYSG